ncbi:MAG TPA: energy-coupling factor ABC transporter permease [Isosphaeraceae bacterium]|jgi:cobalt/nickel transport system permease protein|nr:energy-coupling factor ABC transporter permease [Isosphaeraceae bacterium]
MHIPDAVLSAPVAVGCGAIAVVAMGLGMRRLERSLRDRTAVLMGTMSAFVFAAQMVNFPLGPLPISGHLLGGVLSAVLLGPWAGAGVIGAVLLVQCLLFGDGGLTALGANFINMGLIGSVVGYAIYAPIRRLVGGRAGVLLASMFAAWFSVILASGAFALELTASGWRENFFTILGWMTLVHAAIGLGEAAITGLVLRFLLLARPDLVYEPDPDALSTGKRAGQVAIAGLAVALAVAVFLAPFASDHPDGLEWVGARIGFLRNGAPLLPAPLADYQVPALAGHVRAATAVAGLAGTLIVFVMGLCLARIFSRPLPEGMARDAA